MTALSDLQAAVTAIQASVAAAVNEIQTLAVSITSNPDDPGVEAAAAQINTLAMNLQTAVATASPPAPAGTAAPPATTPVT